MTRSREAGRLKGRHARVCVAASTVLVVLAMLVGFRATAHLDEAVLQWARPDRGWGPRQERVDGWADMLPTWRSYALLTAIAVFTSMVRRSWRPLAVGTSVMVGVALLVTFIKIAVPREDPTGRRDTWARLPRVTWRQQSPWSRARASCSRVACGGPPCRPPRSRP